MSTPDLVAGLTRLFNSVTISPLAPTDALKPELPDLRPGEKIPVYVLNNLPSGRFHVLVKDQLLDLNLPRNTQAGEKLELTVVRNDGRLVFSMPSAGPSSPQTAVSLSPTAQILQEAIQRTQTQEPARLSGTAPLVQGAPDAARLADNLRAAVQNSGLFYESHQQQWVQGQKPLADLLREPQAFLAKAATAEAQAAAIAPDELPALLKALQQTNAPESAAVQQRLQGLLQSMPDGADPKAIQAALQQALATPPDAAPTQEAANRLMRRLEASGALQSANQLIHDAGDDKTAVPAAQDLARLLAKPEVQNLVQQQLQALETHHLLWQGQVWENQPLDWEIVGRREHEQQDGGDGTPTHWTTRLALDLPHLGRVVARLQLHQGQVNLSFMAEDKATAQVMRHNQGRLFVQFADAQLTLTGAQVTEGREDEHG